MPNFYRVPFDDVGEGADLVAALSRQLASRQVDLRDGEPIEVGMVARGSGADVYASAGAVTAISRAFANPLVATKVDILPENVVWILHNGAKQFLGRGDVHSKIIPEPNEALYTQQASIGVVKFWRDDKGYGVIESPAGTGFLSLAVGERVEVRYHRSNQESYKYVAWWVRRIEQ